MGELVLTVGKTGYTGWTRIDVTRGIEQLAGSFTLQVTDLWPNALRARLINRGDACQVQIDGETVIAGHVDTREVVSDSQNHDVTIAGRDAAADLVDCSAAFGKLPGELNWELLDQTFEQVVTALCQPFGIPVAFQLKDNDEKIPRFAISPGETVIEALERVARQRGVLLISDGRGGLSVTRAGTERVRTKLRHGDNVKAGSFRLDGQERFSHYRFYAQSSGTDMLSGLDASIAGDATDPAVRRYRPQILVAEDQQTQERSQTRAAWQRNVMAGRSCQAEIEVAGWRHADGLWKPNTLVRLEHDLLGFNGWLLVTSVTYHRSLRAGTVARLKLTLPGAFELIELPAPDERGYG